MFKVRFISNFIFIFILIVACGNSSEEGISQENISTTTTVSTTTTSKLIEFELPYKHNFYKLDNCNDFLGSYHLVTCYDQPLITKLFEFDSPIVNITKSRNRLFAISKEGIVYELNLLNNESQIVFNITGQVYLESLESGLLSFFLNPYNDEFLVSYVDKNNELIFELFYFDEELINILDSKILLAIPMFSNSHYGGGIIWSENYNSYLVSVGDGAEANFESRLNHIPLDTNQLYGKIISLSGSNEIKSTNNLILSGINENSKENIIATGLRNPWQFFEFKDYLIIADTGFTQNEELNVYKYTNETPVFGWPVFEATKRSEDLDSIENYSLDSELYFWNGSNKKDGLEYIENNSVFPVFYYNHHPCYSENNENCYGKTDIYRAAIIGGDIISDVNSSYNFDIFFSDYLSQELFSLNLITRDVKIFPTPGILTTTSIRTNFGNNNEIIASTYDGSIYLITLP